MKTLYLYKYVLIYKISNIKNKNWENEWADVAMLLDARWHMGIISISTHQHQIEQIKWQ